MNDVEEVYMKSKEDFHCTAKAIEVESWRFRVQKNSRIIDGCDSQR